MYLKHAEMLSIVVHENLNFGGNPDQNKFSSLSNTAVVVMFPNFCYWRPSLCSPLGVIDPENLHRATLWP